MQNQIRKTLLNSNSNWTFIALNLPNSKGTLRHNKTKTVAEAGQILLSVLGKVFSVVLQSKPHFVANANFLSKLNYSLNMRFKKVRDSRYVFLHK